MKGDLTRDDVSVVDAEVVVGPEDIAGDDGAVLPTVLLGIALVHHIDHALGIAVAKVGVMGRSIVNLDWIE